MREIVGNDKNGGLGMDKGAITFLDVLGWKGVWQRKREPSKTLKDIINETEQLLDKTLKLETIKGYENIFKGLSAEVISISDTIALVTYGESDITLQFHASLSHTIICRSITEGLPVRGAISYGDYTFEDNIMVGAAVDEVASWYETVDWIGVIYTPSALYCTNINNYLSEHVVEKYPVSIKGYGYFETYCVKWPYTWNKKNNRDDLLKIFTDMKPITPDIGFKLSNTMLFYDKITKA